MRAAQRRRTEEFHRMLNWQRCKGLCECGCGTRIYRDIQAPLPHAAEWHHIIPKGMGGRRQEYEEWQTMWLSWECHDLEESHGYPHRYTWQEMMREKMGIRST